MRRAVLDPGVLVSALITPSGTPAKLLAELEEVLRWEKFRRYVDLDAVGDYLDLLRRFAAVVPDPRAHRRYARLTQTTTI